MSIQLVHTVAEVRACVSHARRAGRSVGLVPTMGALHEGHGHLIELARRETDFVAVSIFVNPIQFDRPDDYEKYARTLPEDVEFCRARGVDLVFAPDASEMYPEPQLTFVEVSGVSDHLCGQFRPGHFRGVATVVAKLFHIVRPNRAYFGEKDAQQLAVIERMAADLHMPIAIVPVPTVREADGLALSSRNRRLSPEERAVAPLLYHALEAARGAIEQGCDSPAAVKAVALAALYNEPRIRVEYFEIVDPRSMSPVERVIGPVRVAAAIWIGATRLIDNVFYRPEDRRPCPT